MFNASRRLSAAIVCALLVIGCQTPVRQAESIWQELLAQRFQRMDLVARPFVLTAALRDEDPTLPLHVYIEGDGRAWRTRDRPSRDPTPLHPVAAQLAARDPAPAVLYLARPCQWRPETASGACASRWWTTHRYADEVVDAYREIIEGVMRSRTNQRVALIGHSGGGALAALLAARLEGVEWLLTVAANLDTQAWTTHHRVSPLSASLNPADHALRLRALPQLHLVGAADEVVPVGIAQAWAHRGGIDARSIRLVAGADHRCCWAEGWSRVLDEMGQMAAVTARDGREVE